MMESIMFVGKCLKAWVAVTGKIPTDKEITDAWHVYELNWRDYRDFEEFLINYLIQP